MAKTSKIVYVTQAQYDSLIEDGSVTIYGVTYNYDANNTYLVREDGPEGTSVQSTGETSGKVLTADGSGGAAWVTNTGGEEAVQAPNTLVSGNIVIGTTGGDRNVATLAAGTSGYVLTQGVGAPAWAAPSVEGTSVKSTGETSGKVLTADGSGGAAWATGGGSGDVTASGTLSVGAVMIGLGGKTITATNGTNGKVLGWQGGATWQDPPKVYSHDLLIQVKDENNHTYTIKERVYSTQSTKLVTDVASFIAYVKKYANDIYDDPYETYYKTVIDNDRREKTQIDIAISEGVTYPLLTLYETTVSSSTLSWTEKYQGEEIASLSYSRDTITEV